MVWWAAKTALLLDPVNLGGITDRTTITPSLSRKRGKSTHRGSLHIRIPSKVAHCYRNRKPWDRTFRIQW